MNYVVDKRFMAESVKLVGPFETADLAYEWIDRDKSTSALGIDRYVAQCTTYVLRRLLSA